jgi:hypothetical protein
MSSSHVLIGIGLGLDVLATLFLSWDAFTGQGQFAKLLDVQSHTMRLDRIILKGKIDTDASPLVPGNPVDDLIRIANEGADRAQLANYDLMTTKMDEISREIRQRRWIVRAAIAAVFAGGVLEFLGGVVLG